MAALLEAAEDKHVATGAIIALSKAGDPAAIPVLRRLAALALAQIGSPSCSEG